MNKRSMVKTIACLLLAGFALVGCAAPPRVLPIENIACHYTFTGLESQGERDRVASAIRKYAKDGSLTSAPDPGSSSPEYMFVVEHFSALDRLHAELTFADPTVAPEMLQQHLNSHGQSFAIHYDSANLGAAIEVIVHFHVTPGVKLFYKPQGEAEQDISNKVSEAGEVTLPTSIHKGEDYIYARINSGKIDKYIRINVYTQKVETIPGGGY